MSQIKVDSIVPRGGLSGGASGGIIQTVHNFSTTIIETSSDADIISATITPSSSSSKILFIYNGNLAQENQSGQEWGLIAYRGSTALRLGRDKGTSNSRATFQAFGTDNRPARMDGSSNTSLTVNGILVDEPNTTSATTYKVQIEMFYTSGTQPLVKVGETGWDGSNIEQITNGYSLTLMEISG